jgi:ATP-dependent helicase/nuclease subunit B
VTALLAKPGPRWFSIPAHRPFAEDLARGLYEALAPLGPEALSQATVLTPTRRGARALADAFVVAAEGRAVLPPQMRPLGDLDEGEPPFEPGDLSLDLPTAIDPLKRRFELTRLVSDHRHLLRGREISASAALELGDALAGFFDSLQIEEIEAGDRLAELVEADLAEHWRLSRDFLEAALRAWPRRLAELGVVDVSERRVRLLRRLAEAWTHKPPQGVLVAAGSTGTAPATADLLRVIAEAPQGCVVLPGLDDSLAEDAWIRVDEQHPQGAMRRLLMRAGVNRSAVATWPASARFSSQGRWRRRLVNEALRPAEATADWLSAIDQLRDEGISEGVDPIAAGLEGLSLVSARNEEEAATVAALLLREALETPELTAALVTPDQALARRVTAKLARWGVVPDSSAGESLAASRSGALAELVARLAVDPADPVTLLAILKHPFVRLGLPPAAFDRAREALERHGLRGPRPEDGDGLRNRLTTVRGRLADRGAPAPQIEALDAAAALAATLERRIDPLLEAFQEADGAARPDQAALRLAEALEALARREDGGLGALWGGHGGEAMSRLIAGLIAEGAALPPVGARGFADLLRRLLQGEQVRVGGATHPRLRILGAIEARLVRADRLVLAGLEEGVWPKAASIDPFLSRPMRQRLGLPSPERRVGLTAHDFAQAACAPEVVLLHSERREGAPAVKSRWLWRLETLARGADLTLPGRPELVAWARELDAPDRYQPADRPAPTPPLAHR